MALAVGDIIQITDVQSYLGQEVLNVYFYRMDSFENGVTLEIVVDNFQVLALTPIKAIQHSSLTHVTLIGKNLTNGIDITEQPVGVAGIAGSDPLASFYAVSIRLVRTTAVTRHGAKRYAGLTEQWVNGNTLMGDGPALVQDVCDFIGAPMVVSGTLDQDFVATPVIVGRFPAGSPDAGALDLSKINVVASAQYIRLSTQTTRRAGRGS